MKKSPSFPAIMFQKWRDLLFVHWEFAPGEIQKKLPQGLYVDTFEGKAFVGLIPFQMFGIRPRGFPPIPFFSSCLELNCRTYVVNEKGESGIWFFSLDINVSIHALIAQAIFHLPYFYAKMDIVRCGGTLEVFSKRAGTEGNCQFKWSHGSHISYAEQGSLEHFLIERYRLYGYHQGLFFIEVAHQPYPLTSVHVQSIENPLFYFHGLHPKDERPCHFLFSPGVDVRIGKLTR